MNTDEAMTRLLNLIDHDMQSRALERQGNRTDDEAYNARLLELQERQTHALEDIAALLKLKPLTFK